MIPAAFDYRVPETVEEAIAALADTPGEGKLIAGGHSLLPMMKLRLAQPGVLVDMKRLREQLSRVWVDGDRLRIGALATHAHVASSTIVREACPLLADTAAEIADIQIRNRGTIGGSIAHADPAADYPATLEALGARVTVKSADGAREEEFDSLLIDEPWRGRSDYGGFRPGVSATDRRVVSKVRQQSFSLCDRRCRLIGAARRRWPDRRRDSGNHRRGASREQGRPR